MSEIVLALTERGSSLWPSLGELSHFSEQERCQSVDFILAMDSPPFCGSFITRSPMVHLWPALHSLWVHYVSTHRSPSALRLNSRRSFQ